MSTLCLFVISIASFCPAYFRCPRMFSRGIGVGNGGGHSGIASSVKCMWGGSKDAPQNTYLRKNCVMYAMEGEKAHNSGNVPNCFVLIDNSSWSTCTSARADGAASSLRFVFLVAVCSHLHRPAILHETLGFFQAGLPVLSTH